MQLTWIDLNSWLYQIGGITILVDPWLVDPLVLYGQPWLFTAHHVTPLALTPATLPPVDLILLAQGVDDHCHLPTLALLDRQIPVVASVAAAQKIRALNYETVIPLGHWQDWAMGNLKITALPGAPIQPGVVENGWLLEGGGQRLYYEPHLYPSQNPKMQELGRSLGSIDVAIAPMLGQVVPLLGQVIMGPAQAMVLVQHFQPRVFLPTAMGEIRATGLLPRLIRSVGSVPEFCDRLAQFNQSKSNPSKSNPSKSNQTTSTPTRWIQPQPGECIEI